MKQYYIQTYSDEFNTKVITIPIFEDNYVYLLTDDSKKTFILDPGLAKPVIDVVAELDLVPTHVLITHSHQDHIGGVKDIQQQYPGILTLDYSSYVFPETVRGGESQFVKIGEREFDVFRTPGHWPDHICFFESHCKILFCGDILFRFGCGRIFDGTFAEFYQSLQKIGKLPLDTDVYCTHEYTKQNLAFCMTQKLVDPADFTEDEKQKIYAIPSLPVRLGVELKYNPFIRATSLKEFTRLRILRNEFT